MTARRLTRRRFLLGSAAAGLAGAAGGTAYWFSRKPVRLALIGAGTQGTSLAKAAARAYWFGGLYGQVVAVCDVDAAHARQVRDEHCPGAELYDDHRRVLERDDVEGVLVATPDHWHALIAHDAMHAGKAVYCEKPISLTVAEGRLLVRTARETGAVFLGGTQQRTSYKFRTAAELVRNGRLGRLEKVTVTLPERWKGEWGGPFPSFPPPPELNWERWLGQAPLAGYCPLRCHGYFRRWYEYSGGQMTDWGAHHMDIVHWALDPEGGGPLTVKGAGDMPHVPGGFSTPIAFTVDFEFPGGVRVHVRTHPDYDENGVHFEGEKGSLFVSRDCIRGAAYDELWRRPLPPDAVRLHPSGPWRANNLPHHLRHFFACVRHGERPISDVVSQHRAASSCHLANIALRLGRKLTWDARREEVVGDAEANAMLRRPQRSPYLLPA